MEEAVSQSAMESEKSGLYEANNELRDELRTLRRDDRERRNEISTTLDANIRRIAELKAGIADVKAENRARLQELYEQLDGLKEANRQLRVERGSIHPDDREGRNSLRDTIYRNSEEIERLYAQVARLRGS
jgi:hypothetical protein